MNCQNCDTINREQARYCRNCGQSLKENNTDQSQLERGDLMLVIFIGLVIVNLLFSLILKQFYHNWFVSPFKYVQIILWGIMDLSNLLLPFAIRNKNLRIVSFILLSAITIYLLFQNFIPFLFLD
jgi:hypothetical protein